MLAHRMFQPRARAPKRPAVRCATRRTPQLRCVPRNICPTPHTVSNLFASSAIKWHVPRLQHHYYRYCHGCHHYGESGLSLPWSSCTPPSLLLDSLSATSFAGSSCMPDAALSASLSESSPSSAESSCMSPSALSASLSGPSAGSASGCGRPS